MLFQLHWQDRRDPTRTEFVAQANLTDTPADPGDFTDAVAISRHFQTVAECDLRQRPAGWLHQWHVMVCDETFPGFMWAAPEPVIVTIPPPR